MNEQLLSPRISSLLWGRLETEDGAAYKDAKLYPGGGREWDWRETGTHHVPGIQPADVAELLERGARTIVLSTGHWQRLQICPATLDLLEQRAIDVEVAQTEAAVEIYNRLVGFRPVAGLFHSTC